MHKGALIPSTPSGLQPFLRHVGVCDLAHDHQAAHSGADRCEVPGEPPHGRGEPGGADAQDQAAAAQQVGQQAGRRVVALQPGEGPALDQGGVDQRHGRQTLEPRDADRHQAQQTVPGGEVGLSDQVFVVDYGGQAQDSAGQGQTLQDPVHAHLALACQHPDGGAVGREDEDGFSHEEGELPGKEDILIISHYRFVHIWPMRRPKV